MQVALEFIDWDCTDTEINKIYTKNIKCFVNQESPQEKLFHPDNGANLDSLLRYNFGVKTYKNKVE